MIKYILLMLSSGRVNVIIWGLEWIWSMRDKPNYNFLNCTAYIEILQNIIILSVSTLNLHPAVLIFLTPSKLPVVYHKVQYLVPYYSIYLLMTSLILMKTSMECAMRMTYRLSYQIPSIIYLTLKTRLNIF